MEQANSENCGPPLGNKFDLEVGQKSRSRLRHGTIGKVLSQRIHMPSIKALPVILQNLWPRLKFLWRTDRRTEGRIDGRTSFIVPELSRKRGTTIIAMTLKCTLRTSIPTYALIDTWFDDNWRENREIRYRKWQRFNERFCWKTLSTSSGSYNPKFMNDSMFV